MALNPYLPAIPSKQFNPADIFPTLSYFGECYFNKRFDEIEGLPRGLDYLATVTIESFRSTDNRDYAEMAVQRSDHYGTEGTFSFRREGEVWVVIPSGRLPDMRTGLGQTELIIYSDDGYVIYATEPSGPFTVQMLTNSAAFSFIEGLLRKQHDLISESVRPQDLAYWTTVWFQYLYLLDTQTDDEFKHRYITMSVDHPHDTQLQGTYEEVTAQGQSTWKHRPSGLPDHGTLLHGPPRKYEFYVQKGIAGEFYAKDTQDGSFYYVSNEPVSQSTHCCAHMAAHTKTRDESEWVWQRIDFDPSQASQKTLGVLVCRNGEDTIEDRVVMKAIERRSDDLVEEYEFETDNLLVDPKELFIHRKLSQQYPTRNSFVKLRTHSFHHSKGGYPYKLYIEWAPFKSLNTVIEEHLDEISNNPDAPAHFPEMFIWLVFNQLVDGCHTIPAEGIDGQVFNGQIVNGHLYVHGDLKPANVLITKPPADTPGYGWPMIADFGIYYLRNTDTIEWWSGTDGFQAPEQTGPFPPPADPSRIDVFAIGVIIWCLTRNSRSLDDFSDFNTRINTDYSRDLPSRILADDYSRGYDDLYSKSLADLISDCLEEDPAERPTIQDLKRRVGTRFTAWNREHGNMMSEQPRGLGWNRVYFQDDEFELGRRLVRNRCRDSDEASSGSGAFF